MDIVAARATAVDGPRAALNLDLLGMALVSQEERRYGGFLMAFFYHVVVAHDEHLGEFPRTRPLRSPVALANAPELPYSARCFSRALPCEQPLETYVSYVASQDGVEDELMHFCVSGVAR